MQVTRNVPPLALVLAAAALCAAAPASAVASPALVGHRVIVHVIDGQTAQIAAHRGPAHAAATVSATPQASRLTAPLSTIHSRVLSRPCLIDLPPPA
ncbi:MAG: hypothetical protein R3336_08470 [Phycisphaeraceae bacterium]|nr:hypothetical protein [Phycisphaeraceae bacterium]